MLKTDLEEVLLHEELLWFQKSRVDCLRYGDHNTLYFHNRTLIRRKKNRIKGLAIGDV